MKKVIAFFLVAILLMPILGCSEESSNIDDFYPYIGKEIENNNLSISPSLKRTRVELLDIIGIVDFHTTEGNSTQIGAMSWISKETMSRTNFDKFIEKMNDYQQGQYVKRSFSNIADETYSWKDYDTSCVVICWYENAKCNVDWYLEEDLDSFSLEPVQTPTPKPIQVPTSKPISTQQTTSSVTGVMPKNYKPTGKEPNWIEIISYCEVQMPKVIGYDASISLDENDTKIIRTGLRYKIETDSLKIKADKSYHKAIFIIEFENESYENFRVDTAEIDGIKIR